MKSVAKPEWGTKRQCAKCGARFYDLGNDPIICPACGVEHVPEVILKSRAPQIEEVAKPVKAPAPKKEEDAVETEEDEEDLDVELDDEDDDSVLGDVDELEDDDEEPVDVHDARSDDD
jgi:uncharacterized protein (TIGR02300 family)